MRNIDSVHSQLFMVCKLIAQFDAVQEHRLLSINEQTLHKQLKLISLGLASLAPTIA